MSDGIHNYLTGYHNRKSIRLPGYNYEKPGYYFITICTHDRDINLFGEIVDGKMELNDNGLLVNNCWIEIPNHFPHVALDEFVIMPDHIHGIFRLSDDNVPVDPGIVGANNHSPTHVSQTPNSPHNGAHPFERANNTDVGDHVFDSKRANNYLPLRGTSKTVGSIVRGFKIGVTKSIRQKSPNAIVWQRGYYEHIIRDNESLLQIRKYIQQNPLNRDLDT
jgi:putative transposase